MENPIIVTTKDDLVLNGNLSSNQIAYMKSHNKYTTLTRKQKGWEFLGVGRTDTEVVPWKFALHGEPFYAIQHRNMHGTQQVTILKAEKAFKYDLDSMPVAAEYVCYIDLKSAIERFISEIESHVVDTFFDSSNTETIKNKN